MILSETEKEILEKDISKYSMSNYDHSIGKGLEEDLKNGKSGEYHAWNFYGLVWYDKKFKCLIKQSRYFKEIIEADTLQEIMKMSCEKYGND